MIGLVKYEYETVEAIRGTDSRTIAKMYGRGERRNRGRHQGPGSLECNGANPGQVQSRVDAYTRFTQLLGVPTGGNLYC